MKNDFIERIRKGKAELKQLFKLEGLSESDQADISKTLELFQRLEDIRERDPELFDNIGKAIDKAAEAEKNADDTGSGNAYLSTFKSELDRLEHKRALDHGLVSLAPTLYKEGGAKLSNLIFGLMNDKAIPMNQSKRIDPQLQDGRISKVMLKSSISESDGKKIKELMERAFDLYDLRVLGAIGSWVAMGETVLTYDMIWRQMTGRPNEKIKAPEKQKELIGQSIHKFRHTDIVYSEVIAAGDSKHGLEYKGAILNANEYKGVINGQVVEKAIKVMEYPFLLRQSEHENNRIRTYPPAVLDVSSRQDEETIRLTEYMAYRVNGLRKGSLDSKYITKEKLYKVSGKVTIAEGEIVKNEKNVLGNRRRRVDQKVESILDQWKNVIMPDGKKFIDGWRMHTSNKGGASYEIIIKRAE